MKSITIPEDVVVRGVGPDGSDVTVSFVGNFVEKWLDDNRFGASVSELRRAVKLAALFEGKAPGATVQLEDADYAALRSVAETPSLPYCAAIARHAIAMIDALLSATEP